MNKSLLKTAITRWAGSTAIVLLTMGVFGSQPAQAQITGSKHDLTTTGPGAQFTPTAGGGEICVFCHTPHGAAVSDLPLWNRSAATGATYSTYNSLGTATLDGAIAPVGSVSLACLSCHDGTAAMNVMVNTPGSGTTSTWAGTWTGAGAGGSMSGTSFANLTADLKNDHPIGVPYGGGVSAAGGVFPATDLTATAFKDPDFKALKYTSANSKSTWWVDSGATVGAREKTDMLLYTRTGVTGTKSDGTTVTVAGDQAYVECGSCHDPHSSQQTFLRMSNTGSALCLACHNK